MTAQTDKIISSYMLKHTVDTFLHYWYFPHFSISISFQAGLNGFKSLKHKLASPYLMDTTKQHITRVQSISNRQEQFNTATFIVN